MRLGGGEQAGGEEDLLGEGRADQLDEAVERRRSRSRAPSFAAGMPKREPSPQMRRSQHTASATPPPTQLPVICAMVGFGKAVELA